MKNVVRIANGVIAEIVEGGNILISSNSIEILLDSDGDLMCIKKEKEIKSNTEFHLKHHKNKEEVETIIGDLLHELGLPANFLGYNYLKTAIILVYNNESYYARAYVKKLYPDVAKIYNTTPVKVERAIRHAIETIWKRGNNNLLNKIFGSTISIARGKATNAEFISIIAKELENS